MRSRPSSATYRCGAAATALTVGLILLFSFLVPGLSLGLRWRISLPSAFLVAGLFVVAVQFAFNHGRIVAFVYPLTALALSTVGALSVTIVMTAFEREQVRDVFTRFVPESVVAEVLKRTDSDLRLGGVASRAPCSSPTCAGSRPPRSTSPPRRCSS